MAPKDARDRAVPGDRVGRRATSISARLPMQTCWPGDAGPLITWGLTVTRGPHKKRQNLGIYRQQVIARDKVIMRWLAHRGGALDFRDHCAARTRRAVSGRGRARRRSGDDPRRGDAGARHAVRIPVRRPAARRADRDREVHCSHDLQVPATRRDRARRARSSPGETALEGPFGDHTGYYNEQERFPVFTIERITMRRDPIYHSTYTGKPPDEPAVLGRGAERSVRAAAAEAVSRDRRLLPAARGLLATGSPCVAMKKQYPGHAKRVMFGVWSFLRQFMYTKFIVVTDDDVNIRDWKEVIWALTTRVDPARDTLIVDADADRLPRLRVAGAGPRQQDGHRRDEQVAGRDRRASGARRSRWTRR